MNVWKAREDVLGLFPVSVPEIRLGRDAMVFSMMSDIS